MHLRLFPFLLSLLLVCVQQGGILHAMSHWQSGMAEQQSSFAVSGRSDPDDLTKHECLTCVAFAVVATALAGTPVWLISDSVPLAHALRCIASHAQVLVKVYDSRAPPFPSI